MPIVLPDSFQTEIERPQGSKGLIWLLELELSKPYRSGMTVVPQVLMRACTYHTEVAWPASSPAMETWQPYNFSFTAIEQSQEGDLPQLDVSVDNTSRTLMPFLHAGNGCEGNAARLFLVAENGLEIAYPDHEYQVWDLTVAGAVANDEAVTFRLERANFFNRMSPQDRFIASRCRFEYGSSECGYVINDVAAFPACPKTIEACDARGRDERVRGLPVLHPRRFGGFPGIPRQR